MKKRVLWFCALTLLLLLAIAGVASLCMHSNLPFDINRPESDFIVPVSEHEVFAQDYDYILTAFGDVQCRDRAECKKLGVFLEDINNVVPNSRAKRLLLVVGDMVQNGKEAEIEEYIALESIVRADVRYRVCGNHDIKKSLLNCLRLIPLGRLYYDERVADANMRVIGLSNWHPDAPRSVELQKYVPETGIYFYFSKVLHALSHDEVVVGFIHEKPHSIARWNDPVRNYFWWLFGGKDEGSIYNSEKFETALSQLPRGPICDKGIRMVQFFAHTHAGRQWPNSIVVHDCILFINAGAIRTSDHQEDIAKYSLFLKKGDQSNTLGRFLSRAFPWSKFSWATVMLFRCNSDKAYLLTRNLSERRWFPFYYRVELGSPIACGDP